jgi:hypothetical protein
LDTHIKKPSAIAKNKLHNRYAKGPHSTATMPSTAAAAGGTPLRRSLSGSTSSITSQSSTSQQGGSLTSPGQTSAPTTATTANPQAWGRKLTVIFYLNTDNVEGYLRAFPPRQPVSVASPTFPVHQAGLSTEEAHPEAQSAAAAAAAAAYPPIQTHTHVCKNALDSARTCSGKEIKEMPGYIEVAPQIGTMVLFRSDIVEHEVLPCIAPRHALTMWINGALDVDTQQPPITIAATLPPTPAHAMPDSVCSHHVESVHHVPASTSNSLLTEVHIGQVLGEPSPPGPASVQSYFPYSSASNALATTYSAASTTSTPNITSMTSAVYTRPVGSVTLPSTQHQHVGREPAPLSIALPDGDHNFIAGSSIFVSIACYRDPELQHTIRDLFARAQHPERIYVGICFQGNYDTDVEKCFDFLPMEAPELRDSMLNNGSQIVGSSPRQPLLTRCACGREVHGFCSTSIGICGVCAYRSGEWDWQPSSAAADAPTYKHIRILHTHWKAAQGPCWARHICSNLFAGEDYVLQIDSHMRFRQNWDSYSVSMLERLYSNQQKEARNPIITTYPPPYYLPNTIPPHVGGAATTLLIPSHFDSKDRMLRQVGKFITIAPAHGATGPASTAPMESSDMCPSDSSSTSNTTIPIIPSSLWAAGFSFARSCVLADVPYDPRLAHLFFGEEISMAARYPQ